MPYISPHHQQRLADVDTKANVRTTVTTVFLAVTIAVAAVAVVGAIATAVSNLLRPGA